MKDGGVLVSSTTVGYTLWGQSGCWCERVGRVGRAWEVGKDRGFCVCKQVAHPTGLIWLRLVGDDFKTTSPKASPYSLHASILNWSWGKAAKEQAWPLAGGSAVGRSHPQASLEAATRRREGSDVLGKDSACANKLHTLQDCLIRR